MNLSVEEENLAAIPFAVLERRVGKKVGKIEINGYQESSRWHYRPCGLAGPGQQRTWAAD